LRQLIEELAPIQARYRRGLSLADVPRLKKRNAQEKPSLLFIYAIR